MASSIVSALAISFFGWVFVSNPYGYDWYSFGLPQHPVLPRKISNSDIRLSALSIQGQTLLESIEITFEGGQQVIFAGTAKLPHTNYNINANNQSNLQIVNEFEMRPPKGIPIRHEKPITDKRRRELRKLSKLSIRIRFERRASVASGSVVISQQFFQIYKHKNGEISWTFPLTVPKSSGVYRFVIDMVEHDDLSNEFAPLAEFELKSVQFNCL